MPRGAHATESYYAEGKAAKQAAEFLCMHFLRSVISSCQDVVLGHVGWQFLQGQPEFRDVSSLTSQKATTRTTVLTTQQYVLLALLHILEYYVEHE